MKPAVLSLVLLFPLGISAAHAATIVDFAGNANGLLATGTATITLAADGTSITGTIKNTAPFDARITAFGFDLGEGNLNGFSGTPISVTFDFDDDALGNVPQFNGVDLDFGYLTGKNFSGGTPGDGLDNFQTLSFTISGAFAGLSEAEIEAGLYVRFQRVGENGGMSDVSIVSPTVTQTAVPEPASMVLMGTGLLYLTRRRLRRARV